MQEIAALLLLAVALGSDAFSVAVCVGLAGATPKEKMRLAAGFGAFQFLMPITGLVVGALFGKIAGAWANYIGGGLLITLGGIMVWRSVSTGIHCPPAIHRSFPALLAASVGVSLDALAVGVGYGLAARRISIFAASTVIGGVAFIMTAAGVELGAQVGVFIRRSAPVVGGAILVAIGIRMLL